MKRFKSIAVAALVVLMAVVSILPALPVAAQSSASLSIVPRKNYTIEPGDSINDTLTIRNLDNERTLELNMRVVDFTFNDDGGTPKLFLAEDAPQTTWSMKPFLNVPETVTVEPRGTATVDMSVAIPANQGAGSFYSAILYSSGAPDGGNVGLSASGVTLVFTTIPGEVNENLILKNFGAYLPASGNREAGYAFITADEPQSLAYTLENKGNVTASPVGSITLRHMFGMETMITNINPNESLALIGQTRTFTTCIKLKSEEVAFAGGTSQSTQCTSPGLWPGLYTANLQLFYGQNGNRTQEIASSAVFIYMPWWFVVALVVVIALIIYFTLRIVKQVKSGSKSARLKKSLRRRK